MKKTNIQKYDRLKTLTLEEGFALIAAGVENTRVMIDGALVSRRSTRLMTFLTYGPKCSHPECIYVGSFFAIERDLKDAGKDPVKKPYHLNLWGITEDGREVLFTHDHVRARSHGGTDDLENTRTMCCWHNWGKAREESRLLNKLRAMATANGQPHDGMTKRQRRKLKRQAQQQQEAFVAAVEEKVLTVGA